MHEPLTVWALPGIPEIAAGDDLAAAIALAAQDTPLADGDVLVVTSKIVSKAEGRLVQADDREDAITAETARVVATRGRTRIVENRLGVVGAAAGVDASNTAPGTVLLLPEDPDGTARMLAADFRRRGVRVGVVVTDTVGRPWRDGQTDIAIGAGGVHVFDDLSGHLDSAGHPLVVTKPCLADEIAAAGDLVKGKTNGLPVAVVRGLSRAVGPLDLPGARSIVRGAATDLFREGVDEAYGRGLADGRSEIEKTGEQR